MKYYYYFSLQFSAISKTVLRHNRLWSMAGISKKLLELNEIILPEKVKKGTVLIAGGGKFTARFDKAEDAEKARDDIIKAVSTALPMLEFQATRIVTAGNFEEAKEYNLIEQLKEQKRQFRGYGVTYNPHLMICGECGEYPALKSNKEYIDRKQIYLCSVCKTARDSAREWLKSSSEKLTSIERIYNDYISKINGSKETLKIPLDFADLFPEENDADGEKEASIKRKRMAVWCSDLNNMNNKMPIWLQQEDEEIIKTFKVIKEVNIRIIAEALEKTFPQPEGGCLPFRLIIAGGDDFCIVMAEKYILQFACELSASLDRAIKGLKLDHPLHSEWLKEHQDENKNGEIKPYSFGGSFVITSIHTPFKKIHSVCEELMSEAKRETDRQGNSVNWRVMAAEEDPVSEKLVDFEKPLLIEKEFKDRLSFRKYVELSKTYSQKISESHKHQIVSKIIEFGNDDLKVEKWLKIQASSEFEKSFSDILIDNNFRKNGKFSSSRLATMLELMSIEQKD